MLEEGSTTHLQSSCKGFSRYTCKRYTLKRHSLARREDDREAHLRNPSAPNSDGLILQSGGKDSNKPALRLDDEQALQILISAILRLLAGKVPLSRGLLPAPRTKGSAVNLVSFAESKCTLLLSSARVRRQNGTAGPRQKIIDIWSYRLQRQTR